MKSTTNPQIKRLSWPALPLHDPDLRVCGWDERAMNSGRAIGLLVRPGVVDRHPREGRLRFAVCGLRFTLPRSMASSSQSQIAAAGLALGDPKSQIPMDLMLGVSGLRGTIGGSLRPETVMRFASAYATYLKQNESPANGTHFVIAFGRDSRPSGPFVRDAAAAALVAAGVQVIDLDVATTPGVELMVKHLGCDAGMIATASHNPIIWNGIKLLNRQGMAPPPAAVAKIKALYDAGETSYVPVFDLCKPTSNSETNARHVKTILDYLDVNGISSKRFKVVLDSVNGAGCVSTMTMLSKLGCQVVHLYGEPTGQFGHEPEPTEKNLTHLAEEVKRQKAHVGFAQDPDADRLAIVDEHGVYIGEEYTLALCSKYVLSKKPGGIAVANLSTSRMIDDVAAAHGGRVIRTPVGEANGIDTMLRENAVVGGEGNGGVIDPRIVPGRDSLTAIAYMLALMTRENKTVSELVNSIPRYVIIKDKFECKREDANRAVEAVKAAFANEKCDTQDGIRIDWPDSWVHARPSNTEPIMRIIAEAPSRDVAQARITAVKTIVDRTLGR
jgi:phosphomannomutase